MQAYKCDRCGDFYEKFVEVHTEIGGVSRDGLGTQDNTSPTYVSPVYSQETGVYRAIHLCERCVKDFGYWWHTVSRPAK